MNYWFEMPLVTKTLPHALRNALFMPLQSAHFLRIIDTADPGRDVLTFGNTSHHSQISSHTTQPCAALLCVAFDMSRR